MEGWFGRLDYFLLFLFRTGAFLITVPVLGLSLRRTPIKAAFALLVSLVLFPVCAAPDWKGPAAIPEYAVLIAKETLVGFFLSFVVVLAMGAVRMAGDLIGMEIGLQMAAQVDPVTGSSTPLIAYLYEVIAVLVFFSLNLHHWLLQALSASFEILPIGRLDLAHLSPEWFVRGFRSAFSAGITLAAPVFVVMAIVSLAMALLARAVPNFNVLDVGYTLRIGAAFGAMFFFMPGFIASVGRLLEGMRESMFGMLRSLN